MNSRFAGAAIDAAYKSTSKFRLGAALVSRNAVIRVGFNQMGKTHPLMNKYLAQHGDPPDWSPGLHAEVHACLGINPTLLVGAALYVARVRKDGKIALAKPCGICARFLVGVGIGTVCWSNPWGWTEVVVSDEF